MSALPLHPDADDDLPLVVLDRDADLDALPSAGPLSSKAQDYLRAQGITDERTWAAFRLEQIDSATKARFGFGGQWRLRPEHGISIPTFDPRDPGTITGIIRQCYHTNQHRLVSAPVGLAGAVDLNEQPRIVLTTTPLTALRLHQLGVHDVALIEDRAALVPLRDWFATRAVVIAVHKRVDVAAMQAALGPAGANATVVVLCMTRGWITPATRALLGAAAAEPVERPPITPLLLREVHDFARKQVDTDAATVALGLLEIVTPALVHAYGIGFLPPEFTETLPRAARRALSEVRLGRTVTLPAYDAQGLIVDLLILKADAGNRSVSGCFDQPRGLLAPAIIQGTTDIIVTDTFRWLTRLFTQGYRNVVLLRGLSDASINAGRLAAVGVRRVILRARCRMDAMAELLRAAGLTVEVDRVPVESTDLPLALASMSELLSPAVGIPSQLAAQSASVEADGAYEADETDETDEAETEPASPVAAVAVHPPARAVEPEPVSTLPLPAITVPVPVTQLVASASVASPDALRFVEEDRVAAVVIYAVGPVRIAVELRDDGDTRRRVTIRAHGQSAQDRFDLASTVQRDRFASNAARRVGLPAATIGMHLATVLAATQAREESQHQAPTVAVVDADRAAAAAFLDQPDLLDQIAADCSTLGWLGDARSQVLLYLTALSRCLAEPLWAVYRAQAGATPWQALGCVAALVPPEDRIVLHHVTDARLSQLDPRSLRHRLVLLDRAETLRPEAALALRVLHERGGLGWATATAGVEPTPGHATSEARGPVAVLAAAAGDLDLRCRDSFLPITADESPEQTARVLAAQNHRHSGAVAPDTAAIIARHHAAQRILTRLPVVIPFADRIVFPATRVRHREEHAWFLGLVAVLAYLRQRQRSRSPTGAIIASEADVADAIRLTDGLLGASRAGISAGAQRLLATLVIRHIETFTMADLAGIFPDGTRYTFRAALQELCDFGHVSAGPRNDAGRGRLRRYTLHVQAHGSAMGIRLRPAESTIIDHAEVAPATLAVVGENRFANESPEVACG